MAEEMRRGAKTQSLSLRLDPKTKFILDFMARVKGQSITTLVERAIKESADNVGIGPKWDEGGNEIDQPTWNDFWDPSEGVRTLRLIANPHYPTTFDEDDLRQFTEVHQPFFYSDPPLRKVPRRAYLEVLWPHIDRYLEIWREQKSTNYWAAGEAMMEDLLAARVAAPDWPPGAPKKEPEKAATDLDDEIPF